MTDLEHSGYDQGEYDGAVLSHDTEIAEGEQQFDFPDPGQGYFTENLGQWDEHICFLARTSFGSIGLGRDCVFYHIMGEDGGLVVKVSFEASGEQSPFGRREAGFLSNYFYGSSREGWVRGARSYGEVLYGDVWPGIDILYSFRNGDPKYDVLVDEFADPDRISFRIEGHSYLTVGETHMEIHLQNGASISDTDLLAFHEDGSSAPVRFVRQKDDTYGFDVDKIQGKKLKIDPVILSTSTFLGGSGGESAGDIVVDGNNDVIVTGWTTSADYPNSTGAYNNTYAGGSDIVVTKMNGDCSEVIFSTYIGDWSSDYPHGMDIDDNNDIYITGETWSWYFPTTNGSFQETDPSMSYPDAFVVKLSSSGSDLLYSTYVGGTQSDGAKDICVYNGYAHVVGNALSYDFPTAGPGVGDPHGTVFLFIMNPHGTSLVNSMFWGGWSNEFGYSVEVDDFGDVIVGGSTFSQDFPTTPGAFQENATDMANGFILKFRPSTNATVFCSYLGGAVGDSVYALDVDDSNYIYLTGTTNNPDTAGDPFPTTPGAFDRTVNGNRDAFITKMEPDGTDLVYSTFIGGDGDEGCGNIDVDGSGNVYFTGSIDSDVNFTVTPDCFDGTHNGGDDGFFFILNNDGSAPIYSTFLGGNESDSGDSIVFSSRQEVFIIGTTGSLDFPTTNGSYQEANKGAGDMFITSFSVGNFINLYEGWNLVSVPLVQADTGLGSVLSSIEGSFDAVQWYDPASSKWRHNSTSKAPEANDLDRINHTMGFWINVNRTGGVLLEYSGEQSFPNEIIPLKAGWNLVGFPSLESLPAGFAMNNLIMGTDIDAIWTHNAASGEWIEIGPKDYMETGRGYWIHAAEDCLWAFPWH